MPDQRIQDEDSQDHLSEERTDNIVLDFMLLDQSCPWSVQEIARELGDKNDALDAVSRLQRMGLVHRLGELVFPTRAARRAAELRVGSV
jgi:Mn-dependent DtxR family transcriptional regulator